MGSVQISKSTFQFLKTLSKNNNREWFQEHKDQYLKAQANAIEFVDALIAKLNTGDRIQTTSGKEALYRIYNDVRFSKVKTPYNPRFAGNLKRQKPELRGGYYLWIAPGNSRLGCGFTYPNPEDLKRIRVDIHHNHKLWSKLLNSKAIQQTFGEMKGGQVKTAPKGFSKDDPAIELLRYKQFWFERSFSDTEVMASNFLGTVNKSFKQIRPFFDYMSDVLTTDLNGGSLILPRNHE